MKQLPCPHCARSTDSLKGYRLPTFLLFLVIGASFKHGLVVRCPPCMRKELGRLTLVNLLPANLLWVLMLVPWYGIAALRSFTHGHSTGVFAPTTASGYRQPHRPAEVGSSMGKPWHDDARLRAFFRTEAPDELDASFEVANFPVERLRVRLIKADRDGYMATLLQTSQVREGLNVGDEVFVRPTDGDPPLAWVPSPPPPPWLGPNVEAGWKLIFFGITALMVLLVGVAGYSSESAGVAMSYPAAAIIGFFLGGWRAVPWAREKRQSAAFPVLVGLGLAVLFVVLTFVFFEGIFPAL